MVLFDLFRNYLNALIGNNQEFEQLLAAKDISAVKDKMQSRDEFIKPAMKEYDTFSHFVRECIILFHSRLDKLIPALHFILDG